MMKPSTKKLKSSISNRNKIFFMLVLSIVINLIVYKSGGTQYSWSQLNFIVIIFAAYYWQIKGSVLVAILLGLVVGPLMPLNLAEGLMQTPENWLLRLLIYAFVAGITGYIFQRNNQNNKLINEKSSVNQETGLYNANMLFEELNRTIESAEKFCLVFINVINLEEISKYVDYRIIKIIINKGIEHAKANFKDNDLYSVSINEYALILKDFDENEITHILAKYLEEVLYLIHIDDYSFKLIVKVGVVFSNGEKTEAAEIYNKASIAADQGEIYESGIYTYNDDFKKKKELFNEISGSLQRAINDNEFYLVYQPIISLKDKKIYDTEVLLRWDRGEKESVGPQLFIPIAEQIGLINQITKWIIEKTIMQKQVWEKQKLAIGITLNVTSSELSNEAFHDWVEKIITENDIDRANIGFEITERVLLNNGMKLRDVLLDLRTKGYKILIDDFGTGYNSLMTDSQIPFDIIKIDKYFIDRLEKLEIKQLVRYIIEYIHKMGGMVVAEGVETKEQLMILNEFGCDMIQGYYFSKPLLPEEFMKFYASFDLDKYI